MSTEIKNYLENLTPNDEGLYVLKQSSVDKLIREASLGQERVDTFREEAKDNRKKLAQSNKDVDTYKDQIEELNGKLETSTKDNETYKTQLTEKDTLLKGHYDTKKDALKKLAEKHKGILEDEKYAHIKGRFDGLENIDELEPSRVDTLTADLQLLDLAPSEPNIDRGKPKPHEQQQKSSNGKFNYPTMN